MHSRRQRKSGLNLAVVTALVITLLLHAVMLLWLLRPAMIGARPLSNRTIDPSHRLQLRLFAPRPSKRFRQRSMAAVAFARHSNPLPPRPVASVPRMPSSVPKPGSPAPVVTVLPASLFNRDGSIRIPREALKLRAADAVDMRHFQQLPCHGTRWSDTAARGQNESLGAEVARKYLSWIGLYNPRTEKAYQQRRALLDQACAH